MKNLFKKAVTVLGSVALIGATIGGAAAAYPTPFDAGNSAVVVGANAAAADSSAAVTIAQDLGIEAISTGTTVTGGDSFALERSSDKINMGNAVTIVGTTLNDEDLPSLLADGTYRNDENSEYDYEQTITLSSGMTLSHFADSDYEDKTPTVGFRLASNAHVMNYTIDFTTDPESDVSGGDLVDIETTDLTFLGKSYYVIDFDNTTLDITLLDSASSATVKEGETVTLDIDGHLYTISVDYVTQTGSTDKAKLIVDGETTNELTETSSPYKLTSGAYLGIKNIVYNSKDSGVSQVEFSIGNGKLFIDNNAEVELNDEDVDGLYGYVTRGTPSGDKQKIDKIVLKWLADDELYLTPDQEITMPGFEAVKFTMKDFITPVKEEITVDYDGEDSIRLTAPIKDGTAAFNILYANSSGEFTGIGASSTEKLVTKTGTTQTITFNLTDDQDEWFVASYKTTKEAESYLLAIDSVGEEDGYNRTTFKNVVTGETLCADYKANDVCRVGDVQLTVASVYDNANAEWVTITAGTDVYFDKLYTAEGLQIQLPYEGAITNENDTTHANGLINFSTQAFGWSNSTGHNANSYYLYFTEEDKDETIANGETFYVTINDDSDGDVHVTAVTTDSTNHEDPDSDDNTIAYQSSDLATKVERIVVSDKGKAMIEYHGDEAYAEAYITSSTATIGNTGKLTFTDAEKSEFAGKNLIVVGGSCINSIAAELLGGALCGADFTAKTGIAAGEALIETFAYNGKVATLVAGYNAADTTQGASYLVNTQDVIDTTSGTKYKVTSATSGTLITA